MEGQNAPRDPRFTAKHAIPILSAVVVSALILRLIHLTGQNLWYDEIFSIDLAGQSWGTIIEFTKRDMHPPLFYFVLKTWGGLVGWSVAALRALTVAVGLAVLGGTFHLARRISGTRAALFASTMLALSAHQIYYAQEIRMYMPVTVLTLGAVLAYRAWIDGGFSSRIPLGLFAACSIAAMYTHYFGMLIVGALNLHFFFLTWTTRRDGRGFRRREVFEWIAVNVLIGCSFLPWLGTFLYQASRGQPWRTPTPLADALFNQLVFLKDATLGYGTEFEDIPAAFDGRTETRAFPRVLIMYAVGGTVFLSALAAGLWASAKAVWKSNEKECLAAILFLAPLTVATAVTLRQSLQLSRYLIVVTPYLFIVAAVGFDRISRRSLRLAGFGMCCLALLTGTLEYYRTPSRDSDLRPALASVKARIQPGDRVVIDPDYNDICLGWYAREFGLEHALISAEHASSGEGQLEFVKKRPEHRRLWIVLDYHSAWFDKRSVGEPYTVKSVVEFTNRYPRIRLLEVERKE